ncbi:hypothetical protein POSPLADRAFT_1058109 [Postia placenta MAD-698-R-SB12]|uniref:Uncharacterized protein n=1 Tax=Postia placenta MAD-698-R-SB12 TaxID=670580 RepID=A0A1X6MXU2_9APHY|nr:hypothetical protein POSPLADRAFT_1058109 [Postia placenta MAD-698-R-SB12]OSX61181.1 hypothetical protein POSPLADRAFT_1058109 [Postia placenta MAD-698-R-SB12]
MSDESFPPIFSPTRSNTHDPYGQLPWIRRIRSTKNTILSFEGRQLFPWFWPVNDRGERVTPDELNDHRLTHEFRGPGCLCASRIQAPDAFTEARIFCAESGVVTGQWVAACGRGECKYFVRLEPFYIKLGHPIRRYDRRRKSVKMIQEFFS